MRVKTPACILVVCAAIAGALVPLAHATAAVEVSVEGPKINANGFTTYTVNSEYQGRPTQVEVLPPDTMKPGEKYPVLYLLPVNDGIMNQWGSGIVEARRHDIANRFHVICVSPEYWMRCNQALWQLPQISDPV